MMKKTAVRGIAFAALMVSLLSSAMAAPTVNITSPSSNGTRINGSFTFIANVINTNENLNSVYFNFTNASLVNSSGNLVTTPANTSSAGTSFSYSLNTLELADFEYTLAVSATNENLDSGTDARTFIVDNTPPPAVTITGANAGQTYINWTWSDPADADFSYVRVFIDSSFATNVQKGIQFYNKTGLTSNTTYNISLYSVDTTGNVNSTNAYNSSITLPNTPIGSSVEVTLQNSTVIFATVTGTGTTTQTSTTQTLPPGYQAVGSYMDISTTATYTPPVTVRVKYNTPLPSGYAGSDVRLYHYNASTGNWDNITTTVLSGADEVEGTVSSLSPFVPGVPPKPSITKVDPDGINIETTGMGSKTFKITVSQAANVTWYVNSDAKNSTSVLAGVGTNFTYSPTTARNYNVSVTATNTNGTDTEYWNWTVHPKTYATGNRIWDGSKPEEYSLTYTWNPMSFAGFYYDFKDDVGNETIKITLDGYSDRTLDEGKLVYTTTTEEVSFGYSAFGKYQVIGFMAEKYFAGYKNTTLPSPTASVGEKSVLSSGQLHKVLFDDDTKRTISVGSTLTLKEGYVLKAKDIDASARTMLLSVLKDGNEVDVTPLSAGQTYVYIKRVGAVSDLPIIIVRFDSVFSGKEVQAAFLKGMFQISESATNVKSGNTFGLMKVRSVNENGIQMSNDVSISLDKNRIETLMGNIKVKVADSDTLRFYFAVDVTPEMVANQLVIDAPAKATAGDNIEIKIKAGGNPIEGASVAIDSEIGQTDKNGLVNYTLPRTLKGIYNITATKLGYEKATKSIEILQYVDLRLSIDAPAKANQFETITIKVTYNSTPMSGATVSYDDAIIGQTDSNGILNYTLPTSGSHTISASKSGYITAARDIEVRAPYSEYRALDINITPNVAFTNENVLIRSNITNAGTKADTLPVELVVNETVVENRTVALAPGEIKEINFTRKEALPGNYTVEILGQKGLLQVQEEPLNLLLIGGIATGFGAVIIYLLTSKSKMSLEAVRRLLGKFGKKGVEKVIPPGEGKV